jgi:MGT family glycosyltransferase
LKVIITSVPLMGHLNAVLAVGRALVEEGHEVIGLSATAFRDRIERIGARFHAFPGVADIDTSDMLKAYPEFADLAPGPEMTLFYFQRVFADPMAAQHQGLQEVMETFDADLIVADNLFFGVLPLLLDNPARRPPIMLCGTTYLLWRRDDRGPCNIGLPPAKSMAERRDYAAIADEVEERFSRPFARHLNACLRSVNAPGLTMDILDAVEYLPDAHLQLTVPSFEYPRPDLPDTVRFVGALPVTPGQVPLPSWASDVDGARRVVLVTQGTLSNHDFGLLVEPTLLALADEPDILVVVTAGGRPVEAIKGPIPANARIASYLPFEWMLPRTDVLVTNGGYNSVNQALSFGVPIVAAGMTEDKADVSARVAWSGVGIDLHTNEPTSNSLRLAVRALLDDPTYKTRATEVAMEFAGIDTRSEVLRIAQELVDRRQT